MWCYKLGNLQYISSKVDQELEKFLSCRTATAKRRVCSLYNAQIQTFIPIYTVVFTSAFQATKMVD